MSKLILVYGGESTGTRLMTKLLLEGTGYYGHHTHDQDLDRIINHTAACKGLRQHIAHYRGIIWRRSFPHNRAWLRIDEEYGKLVPDFFDPKEVRVVVMTRNWLAAARSQVKARHVDNIGQALANLQEAYRYIFYFLEEHNWLRYQIVSFDLLVREYWVYLPYIFYHLGIPKSRIELIDSFPQITNTNEKHLWEELSEQEKKTGSVYKPPSEEEPP